MSLVQELFVCEDMLRSFDVWHYGVNSESDGDVSHLKTALNGFNKVILWIVGDRYALIFTTTTK